MTDNTTSSGAQTPPANTGPLAGIRILDLSTVVLGAYATQILGDLGADVIKIEPPEGDILRWSGPKPDGARKDIGPLFMPINRNKRAIVLDLKHEDAKQHLRDLIATADVFFHNIRAAGMARLGFAYEDVAALKPDIVYAHAAGYGSDGPYAGLQAYDDLVQAASGGADILTRVDGDDRPRYLPTVAADKVTGLHAVYAIMAALFHRERTGEGQFVEIPMLESYTSFLLAEHLYGHVWQPPQGKMGYVRVLDPNRRPYKTKDGYIGLMPYSDAQWRAFFRLGGKPDIFDNDPRFASYAARTDNIDALYAMVEEISITKTTDEWMALLREAHIPAMAVNRLEDLEQDPHFKATGFFEPREHPHQGPYVATRPPVRFSRTPGSFRHHPPALGEHNDEILGGSEPSEDR